MPRNQSGTYSLPSGNPVAAGTLIDATWANNTLNDIANELTDSLSRSGEGGMLAPFRIADGLQATPGLAFTNEPSTGLYRAGSNDAWLVVGGTQVTQLTTNGMAGRFAAGAVTTPSITRLGDLNTGIYFPGADEFAIATGGVARMTFDSAGAVAIPGTLSVTGDVTVDTNTLFVDAANNRVGVGTVTPAVKLDVAGGVSIANSDNLTWGGAYGATTPAISGSAGFLAFYPNGSTSGELMRLTATGLGIGTSSPLGTLGIAGSATATIVIPRSSNGSTASPVETQLIGSTFTNGNFAAGVYALNSFVNNSANWLAFKTTDGGNTTATRMILNQDGNLGLGVTPSAWGSNYKALESAGNAAAVVAGANVNGVIVSANAYQNNTNWIYKTTGTATYYSAGAGTGIHAWFTAPSGSAGGTISFTQAMTLTAAGELLVGTTAVAQSDWLTSTPVGVFSANNNAQLRVHRPSAGDGVGAGALLFAANDGSGNQKDICVIRSETTAANAGGGALAFFTRPNSGSLTERARITSGGVYLVGTTNTAGSAGVGIKLHPDGLVATVSTTSISDSYNYYNETAGAYRFYVTNGGTVFATNTTISAISDQRLKENIRDLDAGLDAVMALKPRKFDWKEGKGQDKKDVRGFIAQEFEQVFPDLIDTWKDPAPEGEESYKSVRQDLIPVLVKAIQEQQAMIKALEAKVAALEAGV